MRSITVQVESEDQLEELLEAVRSLEGITLHTVSDEVLHAHEGGKIQMKSKMKIESIADLRRVYTWCSKRLPCYSRAAGQSEDLYEHWKHGCDCNRWYRYTRIRKYWSSCRNACYGRKSCVI